VRETYESDALKWINAIDFEMRDKEGRNIVEQLRDIKVIKRLNVVGGIYTQWSDVETEINGLVTYDRVGKLSLDTIYTLSRKVYEKFYDCYPERMFK